MPCRVLAQVCRLLRCIVSLQLQQLWRFAERISIHTCSDVALHANQNFVCAIFRHVVCLFFDAILLSLLFSVNKAYFFFALCHFYGIFARNAIQKNRVLVQLLELYTRKLWKGFSLCLPFGLWFALYFLFSPSFFSRFFISNSVTNVNGAHFPLFICFIFQITFWII